MARLILTVSLILLAAGPLAGCQAEKTNNELMFGSSVRRAVENQKLDPGPVDASPPEGMRGAYAANVMQSLNDSGKDVDKRDSATFESVIERFKAKK